MRSFNGASPSLDNLFLQTLMNRLQIRTPPPAPSTSHPEPLLSRSLEDLLLDAAANYPFSDADSGNKSQLAKEESNLEKEIIKVILSGKTDSLKPNSGQAVSIGEHHICIGSHVVTGSDYRVWEWHGHIVLFDADKGYTPEYIYGNYFERLQVKARAASAQRKEEESDERVPNLGLRELIEQPDSVQSRIRLSSNSLKYQS